MDAAIAALDRVSRPVAAALLAGIQGLAAGIPEAPPERVAGRRGRRTSGWSGHVTGMAADGDPDPALGAAALDRADEQRGADGGRPGGAGRTRRRRTRPAAGAARGSCARIEPGRPPLEVARELVRDHPGPDGVIDAARQWTQRAIDFTRDHDLVPYHDGECLVGLAPASRRWAMAMM